MSKFLLIFIFLISSTLASAGCREGNPKLIWVCGENCASKAKANKIKLIFKKGWLEYYGQEMITNVLNLIKVNNSFPQNERKSYCTDFKGNLYLK